MNQSPDITGVRSRGKPVRLTIEQMDLEQLTSPGVSNQKLKQLKILHNSNLKKIDASLFTMISQQTMDVLIIAGNPVLVETPLEAIGNLTQLRTLKLEISNLCGDRAVCPVLNVEKMRNLETLHLSGDGFRFGFHQIPWLGSVKTLIMNNMNLTDDDFQSKNGRQFFDRLQRLETLDMSDNFLTKLPDSVAKATRLRSVSLGNNHVIVDGDQPDFTMWPGARVLESLDLRGNKYESFPCRIFDEEVIHEKYPRLKYVKMDSMAEPFCLACAKKHEENVKLDTFKRMCKRDHGGRIAATTPTTTLEPFLLPVSVGRSKTATVQPSVSEILEGSGEEQVPTPEVFKEKIQATNSPKIATRPAEARKIYSKITGSTTSSKAPSTDDNVTINPNDYFYDEFLISNKKN